MANEKSSKAVTLGFVRFGTVGPFLRHLEKRRVDLDAVLGAAGLEPEIVRDPSRLVHADRIYRLLNVMAQAAGDPFLGVHVGESHPIEGWTLFEMPAAKARTLAEFLSMLIADVPREANSVRHSLVVSGDRARYAIDRVVAPQDSPVQTEGFGAAHYLRLFEAAAGKTWDPEAVVVLTAYPEAIPKGYRGVTVRRKAAGGLEVEFPAPWLHEPLELHARLSQRGRTAKARPGHDVDLIAAVRSVAGPRLSEFSLSARDVALALGLDAEHLRQGLSALGTSASGELKRLRLERAKADLADGTLPISEIAGRLGYSSPAHFSRFFRSQTGLSPRQYRSEQKSS